MKSLPKFLREHVLLAAIMFGIAFGLARYGWLDRLENNAIDALTRLRANRTKRVPNPQLALIGIGEVSLQGFGRWPWNREFHGDFLKLASAAGARVVSWDIIFAEPTAKAEEDAYFVEGVKSARESEAKTVVIFGATFGIKAKKQDEVDVGVTSGSDVAKASTLKPLPKIEGDRTSILSADLMQLPTGELGQSAEIAFVDAPPGRDGIRRLLPLVVRVGSIVYPTLSLKTLMEFWNAKPEQVTVRLGDAVIVETDKVHQRIPINKRGEFLINYRHHLDDCDAAEYWKITRSLSSRYAQGEDVVTRDLQGKILLIGQVADGLTDIGPSPLAARTPLVLVHANAIGNILEGDYARRMPAAPIWLGAFALGLVGLVAFSKRELRDPVIYALGVPIAYYGAAYYSWERWSLWLPLVGPMLGFVGLQIADLVRRVSIEQRAKKEIKGMFGTYVSPELVNKMLDTGTPPQLGGHDAEITVYFSDIQSFATFSERLPPGPLVELMNEYLTACGDILQEQGGAVDKYVGDMVMAMFGAPVPVPDHAFRACVASQLVQLKLGELRAKWKADGDTWPPIVWNMQTRIGLNTGVCMIGNMGSRTRFNYTMMGDNVNLASRMESGAKSWGVFSMVAEATKLACEQHGGDRVVFRQLGRIVVKGRSSAVPIYEIVGLKEHVTSQTHECLGLFAEALAKHYARDWAGAIALFEQSALLEPNIPRKTPGVISNPSLVYLNITKHYQMQPPLEDWDGIYHMAEK